MSSMCQGRTKHDISSFIHKIHATNLFSKKSCVSYQNHGGILKNTPRTAGGPGGRDRMLAVKSKKIARKSPFFFRGKNNYPKTFFFCIYLLDMPKYWGKQIFAHGRFPEVGQKQKTEGKKERERDWTMVKTMAKLRMAHASTHGARKPPGPKEDWTMVITMAKLRMAHTSTHGARKPPGPKKCLFIHF